MHLDISMFKYKQKHHLGRASSEYHWLCGLQTHILHNLNRCRKCPWCSLPTLMKVIQRVCAPGSIIWCTQRHAYRSLEQAGFTHQSVDHTYIFVNPITGVHTRIVSRYGTSLSSSYIYAWYLHLINYQYTLKNIRISTILLWMMSNWYEAHRILIL